MNWRQAPAESRFKLKTPTAIRLSCCSSPLGIEESQAKSHGRIGKTGMNEFNPDSQGLSGFVLRELQRHEVSLAAQLLGRGMCDNPMNVRAFGIEHRERRSRALARFCRYWKACMKEARLWVRLITPAFLEFPSRLARGTVSRGLKKSSGCSLLSCLVTRSAHQYEC